MTSCRKVHLFDESGVTRVMTQGLESTSRHFDICKLRVAFLVSLCQPVESLIQLTQCSVENRNGARWYKSTFVHRLQFLEYPAGPLSISRHSIGETKVQQEVCIFGARELKRLLKFFNSFLGISLIQVRPAKSLVGRRKVGIHFQRFPQLLDSLIDPTRDKEPPGH